MSAIEFEKGAISIDAELIATDLGLRPALVIEALRTGDLTARCERGVEEDAGRFRLTFFHQNRQIRLIIDQDGRVLERSAARFHVRPQAGTK